MDYLIKEPSNNVLSGIPMEMGHIDPKGQNIVRFNSQKLKPLTRGNNKYILSGKYGHLPSENCRVPDLYKFEVHYELVGGNLVETKRIQPPVH